MHDKGVVAMEYEFGSKGDLLVCKPNAHLVTELANLAHAHAGGLDVTRAEERLCDELVARVGGGAPAREMLLG